MRNCLAPFFLGRVEHGLDAGLPPFDTVLPISLVGDGLGTVASINRINRAIADFVSEALLSGETPVILCGDCLSAIGCLAGLQRQHESVNLVWCDAHGDFHTPETTISGHLGGMPLAMIAGRGDLSLLKGVEMTPFESNRIFFVGGRDLENGEREALYGSGIVRGEKIADLLPSLPVGAPVWLHFDTDSINPLDAPAMRYPAIGGPRAQQVKDDIRLLQRERRLIGLSISAWTPHLDADQLTAAICWDTILGGTLL